LTISKARATGIVQREIGTDVPIKVRGFDRRIINGREICVLYFTVTRIMDGKQLHHDRLQVFVEGKSRIGMII
jgi:hypothetical protein